MTLLADILLTKGGSLAREADCFLSSLCAQHIADRLADAGVAVCRTLAAHEIEPIPPASAPGTGESASTEMATTDSNVGLRGGDDARWTYAEAAERLRVSERTLRGIVSRNRHKIGILRAGRIVLFDERALSEATEAMRCHSTSAAAPITTAGGFAAPSRPPVRKSGSEYADALALTMKSSPAKKQRRLAGRDSRQQVEGLQRTANSGHTPARYQVVRSVMSDDRWLKPEAAAAHIGVRVDQLPRLVRAGKIPAPSRHLGPRCARYDREALDAAFEARKPKRVEDAFRAVSEAIRAGQL